MGTFGRHLVSTESPTLLSVAHMVLAECVTSLSAYFRFPAKMKFPLSVDLCTHYSTCSVCADNNVTLCFEGCICGCIIQRLKIQKQLTTLPTRISNITTVRLGNVKTVQLIPSFLTNFNGPSLSN